MTRFDMTFMTDLSFSNIYIQPEKDNLQEILSLSCLATSFPPSLLDNPLADPI